ncbi:HTH_Tnp_Tc3_2 domain-containing protein [Trichonephila clavipes]|nr:HTH_Tnp_Tc3_2 domain-containing protein [Trichonephila clavipes]
MQPNSGQFGRLEASQSKAVGLQEMWCPLCGNNSETGTVDHRPGQGRKKATIPAQDHYLRLLAKRDRSATAIQLSLNLYNATGTSISRITVAQRLNAEDDWGGFSSIMSCDSVWTTTRDRYSFRRQPGSRYWPSNIVENDHYGRGGLDKHHGRRANRPSCVR